MYRHVEQTAVCVLTIELWSHQDTQEREYHHEGTKELRQHLGLFLLVESLLLCQRDPVCVVSSSFGNLHWSTSTIATHGDRGGSGTSDEDGVGRMRHLFEDITSALIQYAKYEVLPARSRVDMHNEVAAQVEQCRKLRPEMARRVWISYQN